ncbi:MAG: holin family protein [Sulfurisoma sp.]|nr:holin family protein [Sulfurisoma sp.]
MGQAPALIPIVGKVLDNIFPDPAAASDAKLKVLQMAQTGQLAALDADVKLAMAQSDANRAEAASGDKYASRWRPTIGYICAAGLAYNFLVYPMLTWATVIWPEIKVPPMLDDKLMELVVGMLGLAGLRTYEKTVASRG